MTRQLLATYREWPLLFWMAGSVLAYALVTSAAWLANSALEKRQSRLPVRGEWLAQFTALLFFVGVPYLALGGWPMAPFSGLLAMADMGLVGFGGDWNAARWLESAGTGVVLGLAGVAVLAVGLGLANRDGSRLGLPAEPGWHVLLRGLYREVHWAFYRGALAMTAADVYAGTWAGLALVLVEWSLNPAWREAWRDPERAGLNWLEVGLALLSTLLFLLTRNAWLCIGVHWMTAGTLAVVARSYSVKLA